MCGEWRRGLRCSLIDGLFRQGLDCSCGGGSHGCGGLSMVGLMPRLAGGCGVGSREGGGLVSGLFLRRMEVGGT